MMKLPGYYYLSIDDSAVISLNSTVMRSLTVNEVFKSLKHAFTLKPEGDDDNGQTSANGENGKPKNAALLKLEAVKKNQTIQYVGG